jgi:hypothetical protein
MIKDLVFLECYSGDKWCELPAIDLTHQSDHLSAQLMDLYPMIGARAAHCRTSD